MVTGRRVLAFAAVSEIATGVALLLAPALVGRLLFGVEMAGLAVTIARLAGIALLSLGVACWPGTPLLGMVTYNVVAALYLAYLGLAGGPSGALLWPAVAVHSLLGTLLFRGWSRGKATKT